MSFESSAESSETAAPLASQEPPDSAVVPWGVRDILKALALAVLSIFVFIFLAVLATFLLGGSRTGETSTLFGLIATIAFDVTIFFIAVRFSVRKYGCSWRLLGLSRPRWNDLGVAAATVPGTYVVFIIYVVLLTSFGLRDIFPQNNLGESIFANPVTMVIAGFATVLVAPVVEETFFRGFLFAGLRKRFGFFWGATGSALLFGLAHGSPGAFIPISSVGFLFAWLYTETGTLGSSMFAHFLWNLFVFTLAAVQGA